MVEININESTTNKCEKEVYKYLSVFGNVVKAEMKSDTVVIQYELILTNENGDTMIIKNGLTAGYCGAGPHGTARVLKKAGFEVSENYTEITANFVLIK